jgi:hypothetical protein
MLVVLFSGAWRTGTSYCSENLAAIKSIGIDYKIFIHTWEQNIPTFRTPLTSIYEHKFVFTKKAINFEKSIEVITPEHLQECYPQAQISVEFFDPHLIEMEYKLKKNQASIPRLVNTASMYYSMNKSAQMATSHDNFSNYKYFLKLRPDFLLGSKNLSALLNKEFCFFGQTYENKDGKVSDQCFGGDIKFFSIMTEPKKLIIQNSKKATNAPAPIDVNGESPLIEYLKVSKLLINVPVNYISEYQTKDMYYNRIQRPKIVIDHQIRRIEWFKLCLRHNLKVFIGKLFDYFELIKFQIGKYK